MLQDIYYSRKSNKAIQVISQCRILPDGTKAVCFQELSDDYEVFVMAAEHFARLFYRREQEGALQREIGRNGIQMETIGQNVSQEMGEDRGGRNDQNINPEIEEKVPGIIRFLDAETYKQKIKILEEMRDDLDDRTLNNMAVSLDLSIEDGVDGYSLLMSELRIRSRFEGKRGERL